MSNLTNLISLLENMSDVADANRTTTTTLSPIISKFVQLNYTGLFFRLCFALLLRAGYLLIQLGSVPTENVYIILLQNIVDMVVGVTVFIFLGYMFAYGTTLYGLVGHDLFIGSKYANYDDAIFGICAILIGTAIITSLTSGRIHFCAYLITTLVYSGVLVPVYIHWIWKKDGVLRRNDWFPYMFSTKDHAGGIIIHLSAGISGLVGTLFLGRRIMLLYTIDDSSIGTESPGTTTIGYIFVNMGLVAYTLPNKRYERHVMDYANNPNESVTGMIIINNIMAIIGSTLMVIILSFLFFRKAFHYWVIQRCMQASLVGLVSISCGVDIISPPVAFGVAAGAGVLFTITSYLVNLTFLEDYCNILSIHVIGGIYSAIMVSLVAFTENLGYHVRPLVMLYHFFWQLMSVGIVIATTFFVMMLFFSFFACFRCLRNKNEKVNHKRAVELKRRQRSRGFFDRVYAVNKDTSFVEPGPYGKRPEQSRPSIHEPEEMEYDVEHHRARPSRVRIRTDSLKEEEEEPESDDQKPKPRNPVFTIQTSQFDVCRLGSGDFRDVEAGVGTKGLAIPLRKFVGIAEKGGYSLHRTKKHTNLAKRKSSNSDNLPEMMEYLPTESDKAFDDGFVTIKAPPVSYLSM